MKFITSTHLNQWADTKECQQLLPELIKRLIDASVSNVDRISFPSGDTVYLPGWDGVVSCDERIDMVSAGVSLWECGATKDVKGKIDGDYDKRTKNPLGYDKSDSTFVFVTPRIWEGADEWLQTHGEGWKKVVIYTAVELENWIEQHPSVGMWLAEKRRILPSGGCELPETYWNRWAQGKEYSLPFEIVLPGREEVETKVVDACKNSKSLILQALTQSEGIAFAIASIYTCADADKLKDRMIVVSEKNAFNDLVEHYDNLILLTTITEGINYATNRGHTVIVASTPADQIDDAVILPIIEREGFLKALAKIGIDDTNARAIAKDTARDINVFRRRVGIMINKPQWVESLNDLLPAILVGKWMNDNEGDKSILETLSGKKYDQLEMILSARLSEEETPLIHIGNMWRILSPYEAMGYVQRCLTSSLLDKYKEVCQILIQDDDPEAVDGLSPDHLPFRQFKQQYSNTIKEGIYQNLCLLSIVDKTKDKRLTRWVDETMKDLLKDWNLSRFLSNRHYFTTFAEASPKVFLDFIEKLPKEILDVVFTPRQPKYSLFGWEISYTEVLFALEMLAWDVDYLNRVTKLLLNYSEYKNDSNYANKPENSLYHVYRFYLPQTFATFEEQMAILEAYSSEYGNVVYKICKNNCESLNGAVLELNHYYRWRFFGKFGITKNVQQVTIEQLKEDVVLMLQCCDYSPETMAELVVLSSHVSMFSVRALILDAIRGHLSQLNDIQVVVDALRKEIIHHLSYPDANWSLNDAELKPYQDLLDEIEPKDILHKNAWLFEDFYVQLTRESEGDCDYDKEMLRLKEMRNKVIQEIIDTNGCDCILDFIKIVKCPESVAESIVSISGEQCLDAVCQKYKSHEISESFTRCFLGVLCQNDVERYQELAAQIVPMDNDMAIMLYAPRYVEGLAKVASDCGEDVKRRYWESVNVCFTGEDVENIVRELVNVNRYSSAIDVICYARGPVQISDLEIVNILYSYLFKSASSRSQLDIYHIKTLLKRLDKSDDPEVIKVLIMVEFLLYRVLEHQMDMSSMRFVKELSRHPELMIQLVELAYISDDGSQEQLEGVAAKNRKVYGECASHILLFGRNLVSFMNDKGELDGAFMKQYIDKLYDLAKERKRLGVIDYVVGNLLGDIPRGENYPPKELCEVVEELQSDVVDQHIRMRIVNSRGIISRSYNEGGDRERSIVARLEKYKQKTKLLYPRMTKIFDDLIGEYNREAGNQDVEASIADLEF